MSFIKFEDDPVSSSKPIQSVYNVNQSSPPIAKIREFGIVQFPLDLLVTNEDNENTFFTDSRIKFMRTMLRLSIITLFNLFLIYWVYPILSIYFFVQILRKPPYPNVSRIVYFIYFFIDYVLSLSTAVLLNVSIYGFLIFKQLNEEQRTYFYWSVNCWMFYVLYTVIFTYNSVQVRYFAVNSEKKKDPHEEKVKKFMNNRQPKIKNTKEIEPFNYELGYVFTKHNFESLGLGKLQADYIRRCAQYLKNQEEQFEQSFRGQVISILKELNIDLTLSYFSIFKDIQNKQPSQFNSPELPRSQNLQRRFAIDTIDQEQLTKKNLEQCLRSLNFKGQRQIIENFLLPNYMITRKFLHSNLFHRIFTAFLIILMKVVLPTILYKGKNFQIDMLVYSLIFTGFYLHFVISLFDVSMNDDLKTRNYIFLALKKILSVTDYQSETDRPNLLDISCALSIQSWEKMRRIALMIESKRTVHFNHEFTFLAWYGKLCLILYLLCGFELPFMKNFNYCKYDLLVFNVHFDAALIVFVCALRIHWGERFRQTFSDLRDIIHGLESLYSDLSTMFEYYFEEHGIEAVMVNDQYKELIKLIKIFAKDKALGLNNDKDLEENFEKIRSEGSDEEDFRLVGVERDFAQEKLTELITAAQQMVIQVEGDQKRFESTFMTVTGTTMDKFQRIVVFILISFIPGLLIKLQKYINQLF